MRLGLLLDVHGLLDWSRTPPGHRLLQIAQLLGQIRALLADLGRKDGLGKLVGSGVDRQVWILVFRFEDLLITFLLFLAGVFETLRRSRIRPFGPDTRRAIVVIHSKRARRLYFDRLLYFELWRSHLVILDFRIHDLAVRLGEDAALFLVATADEIRRDIGVNICHERPDPSLVPFHFWSEIVFDVADSGVIGSCWISLCRQNVGLLRMDRRLSHRSILGRHRFEEHGRLLLFASTNLKLRNVTGLRDLRTLAMIYRSMGTTLQLLGRASIVSNYRLIQLLILSFTFAVFVRTIQGGIPDASII